MLLLTKPLAKFLHSQKKLSIIQNPQSESIISECICSLIQEIVSCITLLIL